MTKKIDTRKLKRPDVRKMETLISKHHFISVENEIDLIKIATLDGNNISYHVRQAIKLYSNIKLKK